MTASTLLVDDFFQAEDERFLGELAATRSSRYLAAFADRWIRDARPWARAKMLQYVEMPMDRPGHHPLVKRIFHHAESSGDDVLMGAFLPAFDRLLHRVRQKMRGYDRQTRSWFEEERLVQPKRSLLPDRPASGRADGAYAPATRKGVNPQNGRQMKIPVRVPKMGRLFTLHTRRWLQRRTWRYFRHMGHRDPARYRAAISGALARYRDEDLTRGENILDSHGLAQAMLRSSPLLRFDHERVELVEGAPLASLVAAPRFPSLWEAEAALPDLLALLTGARSRVVRVFTLQLIRRHHATGSRRIGLEALMSLLDHADEEVNGFGAELVSVSEELAKAPIAVWLRLLETRNLAALTAICDALASQVRPDRLEIDHLVEMVLARPAPVAQLGFRFLSERFPSGWDDAARLVRLAEVRCEAVAREIARWAVDNLGRPGMYQADQVVRFFDSLLAPARQGAWDWLKPGSAGWDDPLLWDRLLENPHDDVRLKLVDLLEKRLAAPPTDPTGLEALWTTVLLNVHRGSRRKPRALASIVALLDREPQRAERMLPVLAIVARSVRGPERAQGLTALVRVIDRRPELAERVGALVPELKVDAP